MELIEFDRVTTIVARFMRVDDVTQGDSHRKFLARYRGELNSRDTATAYDELSQALQPFGVTPLFRQEQSQHIVILVSEAPKPRASNVWVNIILFILTVLSVIFAGGLYALGGLYDGPLNPDLQALMPYIAASLKSGLGFAVSLLAILLAHEFGHYLAGRFHNTHVTLPYFIPFPFNGFGTMGAFIQMKEVPKNRRILLDIGIAGPLAGLVVAIPVLLLGLSLSQVSAIPANLPPGQGLQIEGNSILYLFLKYIVFGKLLPAPGSYEGLTAAQYWLRYFFTGKPLPLGGLDVMLHPVAWAGWAGLLVTALNLIPAGQLDGGHLLYVLLGKRASMLLPFILGGLVALGLVWPGWWLWALLIFLLGRYHAEPLDQITGLDRPRKLLALVGLIVFILVFIPVPLLQVGF